MSGEADRDEDALGGGDIVEYRGEGLEDVDLCEESDGCAAHLS